MRNHCYQPGALGLLSPLNSLFEDPAISEIVLNRPGLCYYEKNAIFHPYPVTAFTEKHIEYFFSLLSSEAGQCFSFDSPLLATTLSNGMRIQCVRKPVTEFPVFCIRKKVVHQAAWEDFHFRCLEKTALKDSRSLQAIDLLIHAINHKKHIIISGATGSGKTTLLNTCLQMSPETERLIFIEDTREIMAPHANSISLITAPFLTPSISMQTLVQTSLRLKPHRIIVGEIRGAEIKDFLNACLTGHQGCLSTIHADNPTQALMRMIQLYKLNPNLSMTVNEILTEITNIIDLIIQCHRIGSEYMISAILKPSAIKILA